MMRYECEKRLVSGRPGKTTEGNQEAALTVATAKEISGRLLW